MHAVACSQGWSYPAWQAVLVIGDGVMSISQLVICGCPNLATFSSMSLAHAFPCDVLQVQEVLSDGVIMRHTGVDEPEKLEAGTTIWCAALSMRCTTKTSSGMTFRASALSPSLP